MLNKQSFNRTQLISMLGLALLAGGCSQASSIGVQHRENTWSTYAGAIVPGIDRAAITQVTMQSASTEIYFVVWSDLDSIAASDAASSGDTVEYRGSHRADPAKSKSSRVVEFRVAGTGSPPTSVTIDNVDYALADGNLLFVSTRTTQTKVLQLRIKEDELPGSKAALINVAKNRPEIMSFFGADIEAKDPQAE